MMREKSRRPSPLQRRVLIVLAALFTIFNVCFSSNKDYAKAYQAKRFILQKVSYTYASSYQPRQLPSQLMQSYTFLTKQTITRTIKIK